MEDKLDSLGVFKWYRDVAARRTDPRKILKGDSHPFGLVPLQLTPADWRKFKRAFPNLECLSRKRFRLPRRIRTAGEPGETGTLAQADLWHRSDVGIPPIPQRLGKGVKIAVVDSGIDASHDEFRNKAISNVEIDPDTGSILTGTGTDTFGHGTHVASLIAGRFVGVAPAAKLVDVKVLRDGSASPVAVISALDWIRRFADDVHIVNLSIASKTRDKAFEAVINQLLTLNMMFICASGNTPVAGSPADYEAVLTVGSSTRNRDVWQDSGSLVLQNAPISSVPDLIAPGVNIWGAQASGNYETRTGTSQSTAIVSGLAALEIELRKQGPGKVLPDQVMSSLKDRAEPLHNEPIRAGRGIAHL